MRLRKILVVFVVLMMCFNVFVTNMASAASKTVTVPSSYNGAIVKKVFVNQQARWSQDEHTYYLKPKQARAYASKIEKGTKTQITEYIVSTLVGVKYTAPGALIGGMALLDSLRRSEIANNIRKQSEKGPVKFTLIKHRYGWGYSKVTSWNGKTIDISENSSYTLKGYAFIK